MRHDQPTASIAASNGPIEGGTDAIDLTEYERMRQEIDNRIKIASQFVAANLTVMAAGFATYDHFKGVTLGLAIVSSVLWLLWLDQTTQIYKVAAYIELWIAPRLRQRAPGSLGWEAFLRVLDAGGDGAGRALRMSGPLKRSIPPTSNIARSIGVLFGATSLLLLLMFWFSATGEPYVLIGEAVIPIVMLAFACWRQRQFQRMTEMIGEAILLRAPVMPAQSADPEPPSAH